MQRSIVNIQAKIVNFEIGANTNCYDSKRKKQSWFIPWHCFPTNNDKPFFLDSNLLQ